MRRWSKEFSCQRCGKTFTEIFGDAILPKDQKLMQCPLCRRCRFVSKMREIMRPDM